MIMNSNKPASVLWSDIPQDGRASYDQVWSDEMFIAGEEANKSKNSMAKVTKGTA
jgi:hypothetical protein